MPNLVPRPSLLSLPCRNLVPRVLRLLGQRFGRQERLWGNGIFSIFLIGYSGNNEIGEAEVGSMLTLSSIMSRTSQETSAIFQRGQQVTLLVRDWRISIRYDDRMTVTIMIDGSVSRNRKFCLKFHRLLAVCFSLEYGSRAARAEGEKRL